MQNHHRGQCVETAGPQKRLQPPPSIDSHLVTSVLHPQASVEVNTKNLHVFAVSTSPVQDVKAVLAWIEGYSVGGTQGMELLLALVRLSQSLLVRHGVWQDLGAVQIIGKDNVEEAQ